MPNRILEPERQAFSIAEFCYRNGISQSTYRKLRNQKPSRGPREMRLGFSVRISIEAERDWRQAREVPDDTEARLIERTKEALERKTRAASKVGVASAKHHSKRGRAEA